MGDVRDIKDLVEELRLVGKTTPYKYDRELMKMAADRIKELEMQVEELHARIDVLER